MVSRRPHDRQRRKMIFLKSSASNSGKIVIVFDTLFRFKNPNFDSIHVSFCVLQHRVISNLGSISTIEAALHLVVVDETSWNQVIQYKTRVDDKIPPPPLSCKMINRQKKSNSINTQDASLLPLVYSVRLYAAALNLVQTIKCSGRTPITRGNPCEALTSLTPDEWRDALGIVKTFGMPDLLLDDNDGQPRPPVEIKFGMDLGLFLDVYVTTPVLSMRKTIKCSGRTPITRGNPCEALTSLTPDEWRDALGIVKTFGMPDLLLDDNDGQPRPPVEIKFGMDLGLFLDVYVTTPVLSMRKVGNISDNGKDLRLAPGWRFPPPIQKLFEKISSCSVDPVTTTTTTSTIKVTMPPGEFWEFTRSDANFYQTVGLLSGIGTGLVLLVIFCVWVVYRNFRVASNSSSSSSKTSRTL
uniref:Uncharacterized protein n=1 Tax=Timema poppense TaxID=170557 RepID=A0A7R9DNL2_TIMPO|nr:unnamed protein product [Timema poppensis]